MKKIIKKIWYSLIDDNRIVLLDYPVKPQRLYKEESSRPHKKIYQIIKENTETYVSLLDKVATYKDKLLQIKKREAENGNDNNNPFWINGYFPGLDIIMLYTIIAEIKPKRYIEIGSGTSTRVVNKSRKENALNFTITSIDPRPRKSIKDIADHVNNTEVQKVPLDLFLELEEGDILFFDGTHTLYPNSDVMWFFMEILPLLKKGVYVHIHDIYWPYDYPDFMCDRYYNEQYILGACLLNSPQKYEIICPNYYISTEKTLHEKLNLLWNDSRLEEVETHGGSFWFRIAN